MSKPILFPEFCLGVDTYSIYLNLIIESVKSSSQLKRLIFTSIKIYFLITQISPEDLATEDRVDQLFYEITFRAVLPILKQQGGSSKEVLQVKSLIKFFHENNLIDSIFPIQVQNDYPEELTDTLVEKVLLEFWQNEFVLSSTIEFIKKFGLEG